MRKATLCAAVFALALAGAACAGEDEPVIESEQTAPAVATPAAKVTGTVQAADQSSDGMSVTVASVTINGSKGFIAVHSDAGDEPGPVVGNSDLLPEGSSSNVEIKLTSKVASGGYWPMLHADDDNDGKYTFPAADKPVVGPDAKPVMKKITLTVT